EKLLCCLNSFQSSLNKEICDLRDRQTRTETNVDRLKLQQLSLHSQYVSTVQDVEKIKIEVDKIATTNDEFRYVFHAPRKNPWFGGRVSELEDLASLLRLDDASQSEVNIAAVCGLGGVGKTSLATEFAQQRKDFYTGGVCWFSGEDDTTFENSVNDVATRLGTRSDSFGLTFSATLEMISRNKNPWLIVLDNMDQLNLSANIVKLVSGTWQHDVSGHLLITTRRKPTALANDIRGFDEKCCLSLRCFEIEEGKEFLCRRIGVVSEEDVDIVAEKLVQQLGGLPLALEQAGAYIKSLRCTISQYLELYDSQRLRLLNRQKATRVSEYDSPERVAVRTTWHLNFEHIKQTVDDGKAASTFLYASAFLNPNEIQKDIINIGEPPVEDEEFGECVKTTLGRQQVLKLLTDFSLFKETLLSNLSVHHLVQEVIQENLNQEQKIQSIIDAIRMLHYAFQNCSSPDELLSRVTSKREERPSMVSSSNLSRFFKWHKLCLHSYELVKHLQKVVKQLDDHSAMVFQPETARIVYECAIHLSANSKHDEAKVVANFANDIFNLSNQQLPASSLFPHTIPLPELVRRHIQYSCNTPATSKNDKCKDGVEMPIHSVTSEQLEEMRMEGNDLFKEGSYLDALKMYSDAIEKSKNTAFFDVRLLSNRASVYLKLGKYEEALQDADEYIFQQPKCWRGYARKALALVELKDTLGACVAASLAYYYERNIFRNFKPFMSKFDSLLEMHVFVCRNSSDLSSALWKAKADTPDDLSVIILEPGDYLVSSHTIESDIISDDGTTLVITNCILVGSGAECSVIFDDIIYVAFCEVFIAYNVNFHSRFAHCHFQPDSDVKLTHCSFTSSNHIYTSFCCKGELKVDSCKFHKCTKGGLLVVGDAEVKNSEFCGNGAGGLEVREGGRLLVRKSKMYANKQGLLIGPQVKECVVENCELYDNEWGGIVVDNCISGVVIKGNRIFDNDEPGIQMMKSNVSILENEIQSNNDWGITINLFSRADVKKNKIRNNKCGGISIDATSSRKKSVIEYNDISYNSGPGINEEGSLNEHRKNKLQNNKEERNQSTAQSEAKLCYYCKKTEKNLKKCTNCFMAQYCGRECQKSDWKNHKEVCDRLLSDGSIVVSYVQKPMMTDHLSPNKHVPINTFDGTPRRGPGLLPVGPQHCPPPDATNRFIAKMQAGIASREGKGYDPSVVRLYDRSLKIDGILTGADEIYHLVWQHGAMGQLFSYWKKLFMWVKGPEHGKLRVFINEFPPYQHW
ncbi:Stress-induced-phospho 1, partial [Paramuricea clavata]